MLKKTKDDFLIKREQKADEANSSSAALFTFFGPSGAAERFRFLVVREDGDMVSVQPIPDAKFKVGLDAWRWKEHEGGTPETYVVVKTTGNRVDLKRAKN
jgi:hypothetical protein